MTACSSTIYSDGAALRAACAGARAAAVIRDIAALTRDMARPSGPFTTTSVTWVKNPSGLLWARRLELSQPVSGSSRGCFRACSGTQRDTVTQGPSALSRLRRGTVGVEDARGTGSCRRTPEPSEAG